jgi:hypothetical protein
LADQYNDDPAENADSLDADNADLEKAGNPYRIRLNPESGKYEMHRPE